VISETASSVSWFWLSSTLREVDTFFCAQQSAKAKLQTSENQRLANMLFQHSLHLKIFQAKAA